jgi:predicted nicotinamide N-methyase
MVDQISKSEFKAKALELFRRIEASGEPVLVTDHGRPKLEVRRYEAPVENPLEWLRGKVIFSDESIDPVGVDDWDILK